MFNQLFGHQKVVCCLKIWPKVIVSYRYLTRIENTKTVDLHYASFATDGHSSRKAPVLILHGLVSSMNVWKRQAQAIHDATGRTVITPDARNHGRSPHSPQHTYIHMAHDTAELIKKLGHPKVTVLGHSMGGRTAMALALLYVGNLDYLPDLVASMIVGDISPGQTSPKNKHKLSLLLDVMTLVSDNMRPGMTEAEARKTADELLQTKIPDGNVRKFVLATFGKLDNGEYNWHMNVPALKDNFDNITIFPKELRELKFKGPSLFIAGTKSDYISEHEVELIDELFPAVERVCVEGAGHSLPYRNPEMFVQCVCKFLEKSI